MLNALFGLIVKVRNVVEAVLAGFPKSSIALAALASYLLSRFGFHVSAAQIGEVVTAVTLIIAVLSHHSTVAVGARKAAAASK